MTTDTSAWPYDADQHDPLTKLRIPVTSAQPRRGYLACVAIDQLWGGTRPTSAEAAMIASYIAYLRGKYQPHAVQRMLREPLDIGDLAALVLCRDPDGTWRYRRSHWTMGPFWAPGAGTLTLAGLLDHIETSGFTCGCPGWLHWKAAHPDAFPARGSR